MKKIDIYQALWGMIDLPLNKMADAIEAQLLKIEQAGFDGVLNIIYDTDEATLRLAKRTTELVKQANLKLGLSCEVHSLEDAKRKIEFAKEQEAEFLNIMVKNYFIRGEAATNYLREILTIGGKNQVEVLIETHRGTVTQDLICTTDYVKSIEHMFLTIDLSHYVVGCELDESNSDVEAHFDQLLSRMKSCHIRVSNGEQIQVPIHLMKSYQLDNFKRWWVKGANYYFEKNDQPLPIIVELGPEPYHQRLLSENNEWVDACDRWEEALIWKDKIKEWIVL